MGGTFPAVCRFWRIIHGLTSRYYKSTVLPRGPRGDSVNLEFAEFKYRELLTWAETLPDTFAQSDSSPHHIVVLQ